MSNFESKPQPEESLVSNEEVKEQKETPARFRLAIEAMMLANFSKIEVKGLENLDKLTPNTKIIFATTHISDLDVMMPIAKLGKRFPIKAVNASLQHESSKDAMSNLALRTVGADNTIPVDIKYGEHPEAGKSYYAKAFNPDNFLPMKQALEDGNAITMAAYTPPQVKDGKLAKEGGYGAAYLAEISDATIVPVAINIKSEDPNFGVRKGMQKFKALVKRPEAEMIIGRPIEPKHIEGIDKFSELSKHESFEGKDSVEKIKIKENMRQNIAEMRSIREALNKQSDQVMLSLARMLPEEKRGEWNERLQKE